MYTLIELHTNTQSIKHRTHSLSTVCVAASAVFLSRTELFTLIRSLLLTTLSNLAVEHGKDVVLAWADLNSKFCTESIFSVGELSRENQVNKEEFSHFVDAFPNLVSWIRLGETIIDLPDVAEPAPKLGLHKSSGARTEVNKHIAEGLNWQRRNSQLSDLEFSFLFHVFEQESTNGVLDAQQFRNCLQKVLPSLQPAGDSNKEVKDFQFANLFNMFDLNGDGVVSLSEFGAAMSLLCKGSKTEKLLLGFNLFDTNRDGFVSFQELKSYLVSYVLCLMSGLDKSAAPNHEENARLADEMATSTATEFFHRASIPVDSLISRQEFLRIYEKNKEWFEDFFDQEVFPAMDKKHEPSAADQMHEEEVLRVPLTKAGDQSITILPADLSSFRFLKVPCIIYRAVFRLFRADHLLCAATFIRHSNLAHSRLVYGICACVCVCLCVCVCVCVFIVSPLRRCVT
jgi:Ca2+-binding EF-hand superfamily protein